VARQDAIRLLNAELDKLPAREGDVLRRHFGLETGEVETLGEVAEDHGITRERVRQIELRAMRTLTYPARAKVLRDCLDAFD
jgi:RNA polymerase primary sigma factor